MSSRNASRLDPGLIARKGEAAPASLSPAAVTSGPTRSEAGAVTATATNVDSGLAPHPGGVRAPARGLHGTIAVTVRLDPVRYERLKVHGARLRRTNQEIFVEALDRYFRDIVE